MKIIKTIVINLAVLVLMAVVAVVVAEVVFRLFFPQPIRRYAMPRNPIPGKTYKLWGTYVTLNSYGCRDREYPREKSQGLTRIVTLGDSITMGYGVQLDDTYHKRLESLLNSCAKPNRYEVLSFNQGASNTVAAINRYQNQARLFRPDIVILGFCLNDIEDYSDARKVRGKIEKNWSPSLIIYRLHNLLACNSHFYFFLNLKIKPTVYRYVVDRAVANFYAGDPVWRGTPAAIIDLESTVDKITELRNQVAKDNARFIVAIFPYEIQLSDKYVKEYESVMGLVGYGDAPKGELQRILMAKLKERDIERIDLLPFFQRCSATYPQRKLFCEGGVSILDWCHPNKYGHEIAAKAILNYLAGTSNLPGLNKSCISDSAINLM